jgi:hypothetical protein
MDIEQELEELGRQVSEYMNDVWLCESDQDHYWGSDQVWLTVSPSWYMIRHWMIEGNAQPRDPDEPFVIRLISHADSLPEAIIRAKREMQYMSEEAKKHVGYNN